MGQSFATAVSACIRKLSVLKGGPTTSESSNDYLTCFMEVLEPLRKQRYPLTPQELLDAVSHFLNSESPWFPTPGEFKAQIERNRVRNWVTVSRVLSDGEDGQAGRLTFIKCPPDKVEEAKQELFARTPDALPAPERTATDEQIDKLRSLKAFGVPYAGQEVS